MRQKIWLERNNITLKKKTFHAYSFLYKFTPFLCFLSSFTSNLHHCHTEFTRQSKRPISCFLKSHMDYSNKNKPMRKQEMGLLLWWVNSVWRWWRFGVKEAEEAEEWCELADEAVSVKCFFFRLYCSFRIQIFCLIFPTPLYTPPINICHMYTYLSQI